jgi:dipeptidyl aminopeptidase/acylaminoacyl peptidase
MKRMMKYLARAYTAAVFAALLIFFGCPSPVGDAFTVTKDVVYGQGYVDDGEGGFILEDLLADVYQPKDAGAGLPALVLVHGGGFEEGSKEKEEIVELAKTAARRGYVAFAVNYRLAEDDPPAPSYWDAVPLTSAFHAAIVDTKAALRFVHANAQQYGVDPNRVGLLGESAGAIAGVAAAIGDPDDYRSDGDDYPIPASNHPEASDEANAYVHLWGSADHVLLELNDEDPPIMIVHGTEDDRFFTSFGAAERLHGLLEFQDHPHEFYEAEGFGHGAFDYRYRGKSLKLLVVEFLDEYL